MRDVGTSLVATVLHVMSVQFSSTCKPSTVPSSWKSVLQVATCRETQAAVRQLSLAAWCDLFSCGLGLPDTEGLRVLGRSLLQCCRAVCSEQKEQTAAAWVLEELLGCLQICWPLMLI